MALGTFSPDERSNSERLVCAHFDKSVTAPGLIGWVPRTSAESIRGDATVVHVRSLTGTERARLYGLRDGDKAVHICRTAVYAVDPGGEGLKEGVIEVERWMDSLRDGTLLVLLAGYIERVSAALDPQRWQRAMCGRLAEEADDDAPEDE